jgi:hypothetical protein
MRPFIAAGLYGDMLIASLARWLALGAVQVLAIPSR